MKGTDWLCSSAAAAAVVVVVAAAVAASCSAGTAGTCCHELPLAETDAVEASSCGFGHCSHVLVEDSSNLVPHFPE